MKQLYSKLMISLLFAVLCALVSGFVVYADENTPPPTVEDKTCADCHPAFVEAWQNSHHANAFTDSSFIDAWEENGKPSDCLECHTTGYDRKTNTWVAEGVTCESCHTPIPLNHPLQPMPADRSANLCGQCHTGTKFEWETSPHYSADITCVNCHGMHSTTLKKETANELCLGCHKQVKDTEIHTRHIDEGISCAECHLTPEGVAIGEGHSTHDHSFQAKIAACNSCHTTTTADVNVSTAETEAIVLASQKSPCEEYLEMGLSVQPEPVKPFYFVILAALVGMAGGLILSPWIERWYRRFIGNVDEREN